MAKNLAKLNKFNINIDKLALAVSGGVDSIAMLIIMDKWAKCKNIQLIIVTVNHNVRTESWAECSYVKELSNKLGYECYILEWYASNKVSNFQARAREGRYQLMTDLCNRLNIMVLLTAHHFDDFVECYLMRQLKMGTRLGHSTNLVRYFNNIRIIKPLFNIKKEKLITYLKKQNIQWYEDISNQSEKYTRNKIRKSFAEEGEYLKKEIFTQMRIKNFEATIFHQELIQAIAETTTINSYGFAKIDTIILKKFSFETKLNLINYVLTIISGDLKTPRSRSTLLIIELLMKSKNFSKTLHGCILKKNGNELVVYYEVGKYPLPTIFITPDSKESIWDNRFKYNKDLNYPYLEGLNITQLSMIDYINIKDQINLQKLKTLTRNMHKKILFTLPVIKILEKLVAIPHISYYDHKIFEKDYFTFSPKFISRFTHFC